MYLISSFRMERIGSATITWSGTDVTISSGRYAHVSMASIESACVAFATTLQAALVTAGFASATVSYSTTTHAYTLSNGGGSFAIAFPGTTAGTNAKRILGFTAGATATSHTSTVRPYYVIVPRLDARSSYSGLRHASRSTRKESDDGRGYVARSTAAVVTGQWEHQHEPVAATHAYAASSSAPWTWEHLFEHAGPWQEYVLVSPESGDPEPAGVWQLRTPDWDESTHERQYRDADFAWRIRIDATRLGDL